jgi:hypothetical protein
LELELEKNQDQKASVIESADNGEPLDLQAPNVRASDKKHDQKPDKPVWRCKECHCHSEAAHDRAVSMGIFDDHPWMPVPEETASRRPGPTRRQPRARRPMTSSHQMSASPVRLDAVAVGTAAQVSVQGRSGSAFITPSASELAAASLN